MIDHRYINLLATVVDWLASHTTAKIERTLSAILAITSSGRFFDGLMRLWQIDTASLRSMSAQPMLFPAPGLHIAVSLATAHTGGRSIPSQYPYALRGNGIPNITGSGSAGCGRGSFNPRTRSAESSRTPPSVPPSTSIPQKRAHLLAAQRPPPRGDEGCATRRATQA